MRATGLLRKLGSCSLAAALAASVCLCAPMLAFADQRAGSSDELRYASNITDEQIAEALVGIDSLSVEQRIVTTATEGVEEERVEYISGSTRYETNALQAMRGWESSDYAILATGEHWADALAASGLAGALDCPVLLTKSGMLPNATSETMRSLGVRHVIIIGGKKAVTEAVEEDLVDLGVEIEARLSGSDRYATQLEIFYYGVERNLWSQDELIVASAAEGAYADVLSISPVAYVRHVPIFVTNADGEFSEDQEDALLDYASEGYFKDVVIVGGAARVTSVTEGFLNAVMHLATGKSGDATRLSGKMRWETSALVSDWAVEQGYLFVEGAAFASGVNPYDALGGGAMQGRLGSIMLMVGDGNCEQAVSMLTERGGAEPIKFFGGTAAVSQASRDYIMRGLGMSASDFEGAVEAYYDITLDEAVNVELNALSSYTYEEYFEKMNPSSWTVDDGGFYQFAILSDGYSGMLTAEDIDAFIAAKVVYQEKNSGVTSTLRGTGNYFIEAAKLYDINEVYLLAHAAVESAWGCSTLAQGYEYDGTIEIEGKTYSTGTYYNFYGIGAYDDSPLSGGRSMAVQNGWDSTEEAIVGAAKWLSRNYVNPTVASASVSGNQNTLWKMKWDMARIVSEGSCWHQYATSITWAEGIAKVMSNCYSFFEIDIDDTGLSYEVPSFKEA